MCDGVSINMFVFFIKQGVFEQIMSQWCVRISEMKCIQDKESFDVTFLEIRKCSSLEISASDWSGAHGTKSEICRYIVRTLEIIFPAQTLSVLMFWKGGKENNNLISVLWEQMGESGGNDAVKNTIKITHKKVQNATRPPGIFTCVCGWV